MVVYLVVPFVPSIPSSSHPLTVMARLVSSWPDVRKDLRIFENSVGLNRLPGCITPKKADKLSRVDGFRQVASGLDRLHQVCKVGNGGHWWDGDGWGNRSCPLNLIGKLGKRGEGFGDDGA